MLLPVGFLNLMKREDTVRFFFITGEVGIYFRSKNPAVVGGTGPNRNRRGGKIITSKTSCHDESDGGKVFNQGSSAEVSGSRYHCLPLDGKGQAWVLSNWQPANCG